MPTRRPPADFTYKQDGIFVSILPETPAAVAVWNAEIAPQTENTGKILAIHFPPVAEQLQAAGYTIRPALPIDASDDELLQALA